MQPLRQLIRPAFQRGFTLVEIAVVLIIAALALGTGLAILGARLEQAKVDNTRVRAEAIRQALVNFASRNYRLPCPAAPGILQGTANYGVERETVAAGVRTCTVVSGLVNNIGGAAPAGVSRGTVPCMTLGIPEDACVDGWDTRFTYFVANSAVQLNQNSISSMQGTMTVHTITPPAGAATTLGLAPTGNQINACSATAGDNSCNALAVAVVISHGANRAGGFTPGGAVAIPTAGVASAYELENTDNDLAFIQNDYVKEGVSSFDDLVVGVAPRELLVSLSQIGVVRNPQVVMNEQFEAIQLAILRSAYASKGTATGITLPNETSLAVAYTYPAAVTFTGCATTPIDTQLLPTTGTIGALTGLQNDIWGTPIRYKRANNGAFGASTPCATPFVLVSYGPDRQTGGAGNVLGLDDIVFPVLQGTINRIMGNLGGW
jgi:prepilin-type N-terminal cleavage/methylation domain-containing protein